MTKPIHIFRAGRHIAMSGRAIEFAEADVAAIAAAYDPAVHEAPIVVGHPATDDPAYGWIGALRAEGGDLVADPRQVEPQFAEMVRDGRFRKISASFYPPEAVSNPVPGKWYLKHVGFLGAQAPSVKGLRAAEFADDQDAVTVELAFSEAEIAGLASAGFGGLRRVISGLRDWLLSSQGQEVADRVVPASEMEALRTAEEFMRNVIERTQGDPAQGFAETGLSRALNARLDARADGDDAARAALIDKMATAAGIERGTVLQILRGEIATPPEPRLRGFAGVLGLAVSDLTDLVDMAEHTTRTEEADMPNPNPNDTAAANAAQRAADLQAREDNIAAREAAFAERAATARTAEDTAFVAGLVKDGRLAPGIGQDMVAFLGAIDGVEEVAFAEGKAASPSAWFRALLTRAKPLIEFGERAAPDGGPLRLTGADDVAAAAKRLIKAASDDGRTLSFAEAVREVETQMEDPANG